VIAVRGDHLTHRLDRVPLLTPFVGRRSELALLADCWRRASADEHGLVVVRAEAGMGKSRLVREFRRQLLQGGAKVLECRCRTDASASPFLTLAEALRRWLAIDPHETADGAVRKLAEALPEKSRDGTALALLASLLGFAPQPRNLQPGNQRQRLLALLVEWFSAFAKDMPCCLIVEDWQWVDPSMRDFVQHLLDRPNKPRLLVIVTTRVAAASTSDARAGAVDTPALAHRGACEIQLDGLPPAAARELVSMVCPGMPLPAGLVRLLVSRGDGVPLFLEEAARMALELGANRPGADLDALQNVPASLHDLLMARLDGLGDAKRVAQVAAVIGREFSLPLLSALIDTSAASLDAAPLGERLAALVNSGLVRAQSGDAYAFKHALVRDVAYASLWSRDRIALHAQVVRLLKEHWPEQAAARPELLAMHQTEAGLDREALVQWELAASNAAARSAEIEAIHHLRRALAVLARIEPGAQRDHTALRLQLLLAARLIATEGYGAEAVLNAYREAEALCDRIGDDTTRFKVEMGLEAFRFMRADFGMALEHGRRAAAIAARSGDAKQRLHAHWGLACTLFHKGELRATMREMDVALGLYAPQMHRLFGIQDPGIMCMAYSSWALWEVGRPDSALARINEAVVIAREYEHKFSQAVALAYGVSIELLRGETEAALARAEACIRVCEESGFPVWLAITRCMRGRLLCEQGQLDEGLVEMREGHGMWLSTGAMVSQPLYLSLRAEGLLLAGDLEGAANCVDEGLDITERYGELQLQAELKRLRGEIALRRGEVEVAETWLKRAYAQAMRQHRVGFALRSGTSLASAWAARGERERARRLLQPLTARWTEGRATRDVRAASALCETLA
jgi:predicted ATPase